MNYADAEFSRILAGRDAFQFLSASEGQVFRQLEGRITKRIVVDSAAYFVKLHYGVGWREIFKNLLQLRLPVISATNEWLALCRLRELGVDTMAVAAYGARGWNPAAMSSYIVTRELVNTTSLEDFCRDWPRNPPPAVLKWQLIRKVADISRMMHGNGICHRDFYICHFLVHRDSLEPPAEAGPRVSVIDLHRALVRRRLAQRWIEKDLAGLYFSSMDIGLTARDRLRFLRQYSGRGLSEEMRVRSRFWQAVAGKAGRLYAKINGAG